VANKFTDAVFKAQLPGIRKLVLWALASRTDNDSGECWPSFQRIADDCGVGRQTVVDAAAFLLDIGVISIAGKKGNVHGSTNLWHLDLEKIMSLATDETHAYKSPLRKPNNGSRTSTVAVVVREPLVAGTGAVPHQYGSRDYPAREMITNSSLNTSMNSPLNSSDRADITQANQTDQPEDVIPSFPVGDTSNPKAKPLVITLHKLLGKPKMGDAEFKAWEQILTPLLENHSVEALSNLMQWAFSDNFWIDAFWKAQHPMASFVKNVTSGKLPDDYRKATGAAAAKARTIKSVIAPKPSLASQFFNKKNEED
jgi:hypothetical protein